MLIEGLLADTSQCAPGRIALDDGTRTITYAELRRLVIDEAQFLRALGGLRHALLADNGCSWVLSDLALHHMHRLNVPLPAYFTPAQLRHAIDDAGIDAILTDDREAVSEQLPEFRPEGKSPVTGLHVFKRTVERSSLRRVPPEVVKVTYTSGSTAEPKGVCLSSAAIDCVSRSVEMVTRPLSLRRHLCVMPLPTLLENIAGVHAALRSGASCFVPSIRSIGMSYGALDREKLLHVFEAVQPGSLILVPELLRLLVRAVHGGYRPPVSLKFIAVGGAVVSRTLLDEAAAVGLPVFEGYGLSECASVVCLNTPEHARRGSVGRPLPHARLRIDEHGQIRVRGAVMTGYLGEDLGVGSAMEVATGDLGTVDVEGYVYVQGRVRNMFITSLGRNVSPEWVERELANEAAIRHAVAYGEAQPDVYALLDPAHPGMDAALIEQAVSRANSRLPAYAQVRRWACMPERPSLANGLVTANGRLRRGRVLERYGQLLEA